MKKLKFYLNNFIGPLNYSSSTDLLIFIYSLYARFLLAMFKAFRP